MSNTMTYAEALNIALNAIGDSNAEATDRINKLIEQLAKRGSKKGMTKTQKENEAIMDTIMEILESADGFISMSALIADDLLPEGLSTQKVGALLKKLIDAGKAQKVIHKKKAMYAVVGVDFVDPDADASSEDANQ